MATQNNQSDAQAQLNQVGTPTAESDPVYVLQRNPNPGKGFTYYHIWVKDDGMKLSSVKLAKLLADTLQSQIQVTTTASSGSETTLEVEKNVNNGDERSIR